MLQLLSTVGQYYDYNYTTTTTNTDHTGMGLALAILLPLIFLGLAAVVMGLIGLWKVFVKAGKPGWAAIIPFYNLYIILELVGRPTGWIGFFIGGAILSFIPVIGFLVSIALLVLAIIIYIDLAKSFGKDSGFGVLTAFFPFVMLPILGFGDAKYHGPSVVAAANGAPAHHAQEPAYPKVGEEKPTEHEAKPEHEDKAPKA